MADRTTAGDALYLAWRLSRADADSAHAAFETMQRAAQRLFHLKSWVVVNGEACALVMPRAPLDLIAETVWNEGTQPLATRWVRGQRACAKVSRRIECMPVVLGLAERPEQ